MQELDSEDEELLLCKNKPLVMEHVKAMVSLAIFCEHPQEKTPTSIRTTRALLLLQVWLKNPWLDYAFI
jgi:hypothetical protein